MDPIPDIAPQETFLPLPAVPLDSGMKRFCRSKLVRISAGYLGIAVCLFWVFHDTNWPALLKSLAFVDWKWSALGVILNILSAFCQGYRWRILLKPLGSLGALRATQAFYAGFFINDILPLRMGEIARGYLASVWMAKEFVAIIPSMALERLFEGIWLAIGIGVTAILVPLPKSLDRAATIFGAIVLGLVALAIFLTAKKRKPGRNTAAEKPRAGNSFGRLLSVLGRLKDGFRSIGFSRSACAALFASLLQLAFQAASFWVLTRACGIRLSFCVGAAVFLVVIFGTALPNAPANIGTFQLSSVVGLTIFGIDKTSAASFSLIAFAFLTIPPLLIGGLALFQSGITPTSIKNGIQRLSG
jgi:glycosyltransferase 2 family protein